MSVINSFLHCSTIVACQEIAMVIVTYVHTFIHKCAWVDKCTCKECISTRNYLHSHIKAFNVLCRAALGFCIELIGLGPTQFTIYWMRPDTTSYVSYYQVSIVP